VSGGNSWLVNKVSNTGAFGWSDLDGLVYVDLVTIRIDFRSRSFISDFQELHPLHFSGFVFKFLKERACLEIKLNICSYLMALISQSLCIVEKMVNFESFVFLWWIIYKIHPYLLSEPLNMLSLPESSSCSSWSNSKSFFSFFY